MVVLKASMSPKTGLPRHSPSSMKPKTALDIAKATSKGSAGPASREHKRFQDLLAKIDKARRRLQSWQAQAPVFAEAYERQVAPLEKKLIGERRAWAFELEQLLLGNTKWSVAERGVLQRMICDIAHGLVDAGDEPDLELKALYDRHAELDYDSEEQEQVAAMKAMFEATTGIELDDDPDDPAASAAELMERARRKMAEGAAADSAKDAEGAKAFEAFEREGAERSRRRPKTAAQKRAEADAERATQNVRAVYRKLAAALHPDRAAPDATEAQRAERHEQMSRANAAYEAGDLLALLTLQLQIEQVDVAHAAGVAAEQVRHFNRVLAEQLQELEGEVQQREIAFCAGYGLMPERRPDPDKLTPLLKQEVQEMLGAAAFLERERRALRGPLTVARKYLKRVAEEQRFEDALDDLPF